MDCTSLQICGGPNKDALFDCYKYTYPGNFIHRVGFAFLDPSHRKFHMRGKVIRLAYADQTGENFELMVQLYEDPKHAEESEWSKKLDGYVVRISYSTKTPAGSGTLFYPGPRKPSNPYPLP